MRRFHSPDTREEAVALLSELEGRVLPIAGGTDLMLRLHQGRAQADHLVWLGQLRAPVGAGVALADGWLRVDALTPLAELIEDPKLVHGAPVLVDAARTIGSPQVRHTATLGGNLVNASPAADSLPALLIHDAEVEILGRHGSRRLPLHDFLLGPGQTARRGDEIVTTLHLRPASGGERHWFKKFGKRRANIIASANLAARVHLDAGRIHGAAAAAGVVAPTPARLDLGCLHGDDGRPGLFARHADELERAVDAVARPISDVRGGQAFKRALILHGIEALCALVDGSDEAREEGGAP